MMTRGLWVRCSILIMENPEESNPVLKLDRTAATILVILLITPMCLPISTDISYRDSVHPMSFTEQPKDPGPGFRT